MIHIKAVNTAPELENQVDTLKTEQKKLTSDLAQYTDTGNTGRKSQRR